MTEKTEKAPKEEAAKATEQVSSEETKTEAKTNTEAEEKETAKAEPKAEAEEKETAKAELKAEEKETAKAEPKAEAEEKETAKAEPKAEVKEADKAAENEAEKKPAAKKAGAAGIQETEAADEKKEEAPVAAKKAEPATEETKETKKPVVEKAEADAPAVEEEFDWDKFETNVDSYSKKQRSDYESLYENTFSKIDTHEVVDGTVISLNNREVVINIGYKSEGIVSLNEFRYNPDLKVDDTVEVYVESKEDKNGQLVLSHKKARSLKSWDRVNEALDKDEVINGFIKCRTKGGMIVDVFGIEAFLPGSQIDVRPIRDYDVFVGKTMEFKVVKINNDFKNVVVSHKALIEAELEQQKKEIIAKLEKGQVLEGTVKNITSYGVFIDLGGVDGLIHITDLSWGRVNHPEEVVELDQKLNVVILDFNDDKKRIALGLKQLSAHPWDSLDEKIKIGDKVKGKVVVLADYGAFIEIAPGVEGLIHVSEMSWSQHLRSAQEFLKVGDKVDAVILTLDRDERKMSLGLKQLKPDPWEKIEQKYPVDTKHKAIVRNFTNFGVFVEIEEGVDGLIHISDLSWTKKVKHPAEFTSIGEEIEVVVLEIDKENRRLSLGHKQLEENPWDVFETVFTLDSIHEGTVIEVFDKGAIVALPYGVEGFVGLRHIKKEDGSKVKVDEQLKFKVIEFNKGAKRIVLSHTRIFEDAGKAHVKSEKATEKSETQKAARKVKASLQSTTLGDISELAKLKSEMEENEKKTVEKKKK